MVVKFFWRSCWVGVALALAASGAHASSSSLGDGFRLSQTCAGCHGTAGASPGNTIPVIGGQTAAYLADSMRAYKMDERKFYVMNIIAKAFVDSEIDAISDWLSSQPWVNTETAVDSAKQAAGAPLAVACVECHGPGGEGTDLGPRIAGQPARYTAKVMSEYKAKSRGNSNAMQMVIATTLSDEEIEALAHYYAGLR